MIGLAPATAIENGCRPLPADELARIMARPEPEAVDLTVPEPEVRSRPAAASEIPSGARSVIRRAEAEGFVVWTTYARGPRLDAHWKVVEISDSVVVRGDHVDGRRFVACWISKTAQRGAKAGQTSHSFDFAYAHRVGRCNATALSAYLVAPN